MMYNEWFSHMNKLLQNDISFTLKLQMVLVKMYFLFQFTFLQPYFYVKYKTKKYNQ